VSSKKESEKVIWLACFYVTGMVKCDLMTSFKTFRHTYTIFSVVMTRAISFSRLVVLNPG